MSAPATSPPENLIVGQVVAPFGVKGELKVNILTEFPERFHALDTLILAPFGSIEPGLAPKSGLNPSSLRRAPRHLGGTRKAPAAAAPADATSFKIESTHIHKGQLLLKLEGVDSVDAAESLRGCWVLVPLQDAKKLPRGAYYLYQIVGLDVYTTSRKYLGKVEDVITAAANDVYVVKGPGVTDPRGELLVPAIKPVVKRVELKRGRLIVVDPVEWT